MADDYGYANARLRAMWGRLLTTADYERLLARENVEAVIAVLSTTEYKEDVESAVLHATGVQCVAAALRLNTARTFQKVRGFFDAAEQQRLIQILLSRWDLFNLKTVIRGQIAQIPAADVLESVVPAGQLDMLALETLAKQPGLQAMAGLMLTQQLPYAHPLAIALHSYRGREDLAALELALTRYHYASILEALEGGSQHADLVRAMVDAEIDTLNLSVYLRLWRESQRTLEQMADSKSWLIAGGTVGERRWKRLLVADSVDTIVKTLQATAYGRIVDGGLRNGATDIYRLLERHLTTQGVNMWYGDPLSISMAIGYMWAKVSEVTNLRLIAYAVAGELAREIVRMEWNAWRN